MADWNVAIPSHQRADTIGERTLRMLAEGGVDRERVHVFVGDKEADEYRSGVDPGLYGHLVTHRFGGDVTQSNNAVNDFFGNGRIVHCDDDLDGISQLVDEKTLAPVVDIPAMFEEGFARARSHAASLWGIYPVRNPYFMRRRVMTKLCFVIGHVYGQVLQGRKGELVTVPVKVDYERSLSHFMMDGCVCRMDWYVADTKVYAGKGGLVATRTPALAQDAINLLAQRYPGLVRQVHHRKRDWPEMRLVPPRG